MNVKLVKLSLPMWLLLIGIACGLLAAGATWQFWPLSATVPLSVRRLSTAITFFNLITGLFLLVVNSWGGWRAWKQLAAEIERHDELRARALELKTRLDTIEGLGILPEPPPPPAETKH